MSPRRAREVILRAVRDPASTLALSLCEWNDLIAIARQTGLLARLGVQLQGQGLTDRVPQKARAQLHAACIAAESSQTAIRFEIQRVLRALSQVETPIILLKGAAYLIAELPPARGRLLGDLDLMVPQEKLDAVEQTLTQHGWETAQMEEYDQRFYREWMHEIPPLQHPKRDTPVDLHHTIAPRTSRVKPNAQALVAASVRLAGSRLRILAPADMVLHSAVHLFNDEVVKRLRDLCDLHDLLCCFGAQAQFWEELLSRAQLHSVERPLYYMLRHTQRIFDTPVPRAVEIKVAKWGPPGPVDRLMDWIFAATFDPKPLDGVHPRAALAHWLLYVRSHWLRMPTRLLVQHLAIKAARRTRERFVRTKEA